MDLDFSEDQEALRVTLREFFEKESPPEAVRAAEPLGFDAGLWRKAVEMGLGAIAVPEERGGGGAGWVELAIAAECLGRTLAPVPLVEAAVANRLLASAPRAADLDPLVERAVGGEALATLALHPVAGDVARLVPAGAVADIVVALRGDELRAVPGQAPATLALHPVAGDVARLVPAGAVADIVVALRDDELLAVPLADVPGEAVPNLGAMPIADRRLDGEGAAVLAKGPEAVAAHDRAVHHWRMLTGAALVGVAARALEIGLAYVMERRAFGVLIGGFQTIQHRLADNSTALEGARLLAYKAAWAHDEGLPKAAELAAMSLLFASETAFRTASDSLHFHGGYGYTLEYDIQLYFRRAKAWPLVAGDPRAVYGQLPRRLYDATEG